MFVSVRLQRYMRGVTIHPPREYSGDRGTVPVQYRDGGRVTHEDRVAMLVYDRVHRAYWMPPPTESVA